MLNRVGIIILSLQVASCVSGSTSISPGSGPTELGGSVGNPYEGGGSVGNPLLFHSIPQGLPGYTQLATAQVYQVALSSQGRLFAATSGGLSYTDNLNLFTTRTTTHGLASNKVKTVVEFEGKIFAGHDSYISISSDSGDTFQSGYIGDFIFGQRFAVDADPIISNIRKIGTSLFMVTNIGVYEMKSGESRFTRIFPDSSLNNFGFSALNNCIRNVDIITGMIFVSTCKGLFFKKVTSSFFTINTLDSQDPDSQNVYGVTPYGSNEMLATTKAGVFKGYVFGLNKFYKKVFSLNGDFAHTIVSEGTMVYLGSKQSGFFRSSNGVDFVGSIDGLRSNSIEEIYVSGGSVYLSTLGGISISRNQGVSFETLSSGLTSQNITQVGLLNSSVIVGATPDDGLVVSHDDGFTFDRLIADGQVSGLASNVVYNLRSGKNIVVATNAGVSISSDGRTFQTIHAPAGVYPQAFDALWLNTGSLYAAFISSILSIPNLQSSFQNAEIQWSPSAPDFVVQMEEDTAGNLYFLTNKGLYRRSANELLAQRNLQLSGLSADCHPTKQCGLYINNKDQVFVFHTDYASQITKTYVQTKTGEFQQIYTNLRVRALLHTEQYGILVGTNSGLHQSLDHGQSFKRYTTADGLSSNVINSLSYDARTKNLLVGTDAGISKGQE